MGLMIRHGQCHTPVPIMPATSPLLARLPRRQRHISRAGVAFARFLACSFACSFAADALNVSTLKILVKLAAQHDLCALVCGAEPTIATVTALAVADAVISFLANHAVLGRGNGVVSGAVHSTRNLLAEATCATSASAPHPS